MRKGTLSHTAPLRQRKYGWRHMLRERSWAGLSLIVAVTTIMNVSSVSALFQPEAAYATFGKVAVKKQVDLNGDGDWNDANEKSNTTANNLGFRWKLDNSGSWRNMGTDQSVSIGNHTATENSVPGYHLVGWYVDEGSCSQPEGTTLPVTVAVAHSDTDTVTFCNAKDLTGTIKVNKKVDSDGNGTFEGGNTTANNLGFRWGVDAGAVTRSMGTEIDVPTGNHTVTENSIDGYHLVGWYVDGRGSCTEPQGTTLPVTVSLDNDDTDTVTFCNAKNKEEEKPITLNAWKIVCTEEADLPNWGLGGPNVTSATAADWVASHESCDFQSGWDFQWAPDYPGNPGDNTGAAGSPWTTFGSTDANGFTSTSIDLGEMSKMWIREVWQLGYIPFTYNINGNNSDPVSAELYCHNDALNYDNYDWIDNLKPGETYNCVAWNVQENGSVTVTKKLDADGDGQFETTNPQGWSWQLDNTTGLVMGATEVATPGDHTIIEHGPSDGYHFVGWYPTGQDYSCENLPDNTLNQTHPITVSVTVGQDTAITICNQKDAPKTGTIIVHKEVDVNGNGVFTDNVDGTDTKGNALGFRWGVTENATTEVFGDSLVVPAGDVSVWEKPVDGYSLVGWHYTGDDVICTPRVIRDTKTAQGNLPSDVTVSVGEGQTVEITLCNQRDTGTIDGYKWHDRDSDGVWDEGEEPLANFRIQTLHGQGGTTDENGYYRIENVPTGIEHVVEFAWNGSAWTSPDNLGWVMTYPTNFYGYGAMDLHITAGGTVHQNFGNFQRGSIAGSKFSDENHNGSWDEGEPSLANWTIELWKFDQYYFDHTDEYGVNDGYLKEMDTVTNENGDYSFPDLGPGKYRVREVQQDGWTQTTTNPADVEPLMSGQHVTNADFGNYGIPNVTIAKTVDKTTATPGEILTYTITVTNSGAGDAYGVRVDDTLPTAFVGTPTNISPAPTSQPEGHLVWDNVMVPANGGTFVATFKLAVNAVMPAGATVITNTVNLGNSILQDVSAFSLQSAVTPIIVGPVYSGQATAVTTVNAAPTITLDKQGPATATPGQQISYTLNWTVSGNASATNAIVTDTLPANTTFVSADNSGSFLNGVVTWNLGTKAPGTSGTLTVTVLVSPSLTSSATLTNTGVFDTDQNQPATDTVQTNVLVPQVLGISAEADLTITKSVDQTTATPGETLTYTLVIANTGEADATNVVVTDNLPDGFVFLAGGKTTRTWNLGTLAAGASKTLIYKVVVGNDVIAGEHVNRAFVTADFFDPIVAQAIVTVKVPQVLGLADTGAGLRDLLTFILGFVLLAIGSLGFRKLRRGSATA